MTVENFLRNEHGYSAKIIRKLKREKEHIALNGEHIRMVDFLEEGDVLMIILDDTPTIIPNPDLDVPIVYEDEDIIVFNKPVNMPVHPSLAHYEDTLANFYAHHLNKSGDTAIFRPINRLDTDTTGLCLACKNHLAAKKLSKAVTKQYTAIACGYLSEKSGRINAPIGRDDSDLMRRIVREDGKESITDYKVVAEKNGYSQIEVDLLTGRTHQIRVHFTHLGHPLAGDMLYGGSIKHITTQALCCTKLIFMHPINNKTMEICINIPNFMENILK